MLALLPISPHPPSPPGGLGCGAPQFSRGPGGGAPLGTQGGWWWWSGWLLILASCVAMKAILVHFVATQAILAACVAMQAIPALCVAMQAILPPSFPFIFSHILQFPSYCPGPAKKAKL